MSTTKGVVTRASIQGIADGIRYANGSSTEYLPGEMEAAVRALKKTLVSKTATTNGTYDPEDDNADGYNEFIVDVEGGGGGGSTNILSGTDAPTSSVGEDGAIYLQTTPFGVKNVGGQYIDTGYSGNANSKYVIDFRFDKAQSSEWACPFGGRPNSSIVHSASLLTLAISSRNYSQTSVQWGSDANIGTGWYGASSLQGKLIHAEVSAGLARMSADGNQFPDVTWTPTAVTDTTRIGLFAAFANNAYQYWSYMDEMILYRFRIYESDVLVHDFVPTIDLNDIVCIKDNISGEYKYPNSGSLTGVPESDDIFVTYLKVNGAWQSLIGSDINDVNR